MTARARLIGALGAVAVVLGTGCQEVEPEAAPVHEPATLEEVDGLDVPLVVFDRAGAQSVALRTERVRRAGDGTEVPYAALIYDPGGTAWVYTSPQPLTYVRTKVVVERITGDLVRIADGPPPGTRVVTTGAAEVYGAELGIAGGH